MPTDMVLPGMHPDTTSCFAENLLGFLLGLERNVRRSDRPNPRALEGIIATLHLVPERTMATLAFLDHVTDGEITVALAQRARALVDTADGGIPDAPAFIEASEAAVDAIRRKLQSERTMTPSVLGHPSSPCAT
jgi:hypothetical protein